jgi:hypothetical protein
MRTTDGKVINSDGLMPLLEQFGGDKERFLQFAVQNVYFLNPEKANRKWQKQRAEIDATKKGIIRHTATIFKTDKRQATKEYTRLELDDGKLELFVIADKDGNSAVRKLFKEMTGILSSFGKASNVTNYTLTHIWGLTDNPYSFTAPWNIALTSTFIAPLSDGNADPKHIRHIFQSTFRAIAWLLYKDVADWRGIIPKGLHPTDEYLAIAKKLIDDKTVRVLE